MKNKKGFTLIELMGVIVIIGILLLIAIPAVDKYMRKGKNNYYVSLEEEIKTAGMNYMETYRTLLPRQIGHYATVTLDELVENKYMEEVVDENGVKCSGKVTIEKVSTEKYTYVSYLDCGNKYQSDPANAAHSEDDNVYADSTDYTIGIDAVKQKLKNDGYEYVIATGKFRVAQGTDFTLPPARVYKNGVDLDINLEAKPTKIDTNELGSKEAVYSYHGVVEKVLVDVVDKSAPSKPEVVVRLNNASGKSYDSSTWFSGNIYALFNSTDYVKQGVLGSGIRKYQVSTNGTSFSDLTGNSETMRDEGSYTRYVRSVDNNGNVSEPSRYSYKIDKTKPNKATLTEVNGSSKDTGGWYPGNATIKITAGTDPCATGANSCSGTKRVTYILTGATKKGETEITSGNTITISNNGITTITAYTYDNADNKSDSVTLVVKKDQGSSSYTVLPQGNISTAYADNIEPGAGNDYYYRLWSHVHTGSSTGGGCYNNHHTGERCSSWCTDSVDGHGVVDESDGNGYQAGREFCTCKCGGRSWTCGCSGEVCQGYESYDYYTINCGKTPSLGTVRLYEAKNLQRTSLKISTNGLGTITSATWTGDVVKVNNNEVILNKPGTYKVTFTYQNGDYTKTHTFTYVNTNQIQ